METKIFVPDMHCEHCVKRIDTALKGEGINYSISLENKTVTINGCEHCKQRSLFVLEDLGFTPEVK